MSNLSRNRSFVIIGYTILGGLAGFLTERYQNWTFLLLLIFIGFLTWPYVNKRFYKMDEIDIRVSHKAGYIAYNIQVFAMMVLVMMHDHGQLEQFGWSLSGALIVSVVLSVILYAVIAGFYSSYPDKL